MKWSRFVVVSLLVLLSFPLTAGDDFCGIRNTSFKNGEVINFKVYYTLGVYVAAGEATFKTTLERMNNKPVYHIVGEGKTYSFYDNFFKVRDKYETYIDTATLQPFKFIRNVYEGGYYQVHQPDGKCSGKNTNGIATVQLNNFYSGFPADTQIGKKGKRWKYGQHQKQHTYTLQGLPPVHIHFKDEEQQVILHQKHQVTAHG